MLDLNAIRQVLLQANIEPAGLPRLEPLLRKRMSPAGHGDYDKWCSIVESLRDTVDLGERRQLLLQLSPWRKGPFDVGGVHIDAEWRSDLKWDRVEDAITPLEGRAVLDVGCGNGYYALRMQEAGARAVLGVDPTLLYVMQFLAVTLERRSLYRLPFCPCVCMTCPRTRGRSTRRFPWASCITSARRSSTCGSCARPCDIAGSWSWRRSICRARIPSRAHPRIDTRA